MLVDRGRVIHAPLVVKPTRGFGKQFSAVCKTDAELAAFVATLDAARKQSDPMINLIVNNNYILEEYVTGSLHSSEVIVKDGEVLCFATTTRYRSQHNDLLEMGYSMPSGLEGHKLAKLEQYVSDVFKCLALDFGLYHVEILYADDGPCLVEINGRMMGASALRCIRRFPTVMRSRCCSASTSPKMLRSTRTPCAARRPWC